jgi:serine/threonine protein kinase
MNDFDAPTIITTPPTRTVSPVMTEPPLGADNYQIGHEIARGGMGSILEAEDSKLKRTVAVKIMHLDANADASMRQRFLREAEVLAMLAHPNIVPIHDIVWEDGLPLFYSLKMVKGRTRS